MTLSVSHNANGYSRLQAWLDKDNNRVGLWVTRTTCSLAYAVSNLGAAISRLGNRIHDDAPGDYEQGQNDGSNSRPCSESVVRGPPARMCAASCASSTCLPTTPRSSAWVGRCRHEHGDGHHDHALRRPRAIPRAGPRARLRSCWDA